MESITYIKERLHEFFESFPRLDFRYEYRSSIRLHIIEVNPTSAFENDLEYIEAELELEERFYNLFPQEELLFITEGSLTTITTPILELGKEKLLYSLTLSFPSFFSNSDEEDVFDDCEDYSLAA